MAEQRQPDERLGLSDRLSLIEETACEPRTPVRYIHGSLEGNWLT
jgi:hypothetical protein